MDSRGEMKPASAAKLTYENFMSFPDDGLRHELIDGEHHVTPSPTTKHQRVAGELFFALRSHLATAEQGQVLFAPLDVVLSPRDVVVPDLIVVLKDQASIVTPAQLRGAPAIVVEILSPGTRRRDETLKRGLHERTGVREYWLVDPEREAVDLWRRGFLGAFDLAARLTADAGGTLVSDLLPGFSLRLARLFAEPR